MCDWFNEKLNSQYLGRIFEAERTLGKRKAESRVDTEGKGRRRGKSEKSHGNTDG